MHLGARCSSQLERNLILQRRLRRPLPPPSPPQPPSSLLSRHQSRHSLRTCERRARAPFPAPTAYSIMQMLANKLASRSDRRLTSDNKRAYWRARHFCCRHLRRPREAAFDARRTTRADIRARARDGRRCLRGDGGGCKLRLTSLQFVPSCRRLKAPQQRIAATAGYTRGATTANLHAAASTFQTFLRKR